MRAIKTGFLQMLLTIRGDMMLFAACFTPILCGLFFRLGIPALSFIPTFYYGIFDLFFSVLSPTMYCFVAAMVVLEETDDRIAGYLFITPLGKCGYFTARLGIPSALAFFITCILLPLFQLSKLPPAMLLLLSAAGSAQGLIIGMLIVSLSSNKLEGMAVTKLSSLMTLGIAVPYFVRGPYACLASFLPSFWMGRGMRDSSFQFLLISLLLSAVWCICLKRKFMKKIR